MLVFFDNKQRECLRVFLNATEEQKQNGIEVREEDIPHKDGFHTVIYKKSNGVEYKFEEIKEEKSGVEILQEKLETIEKKSKEREKEIKDLKSVIDFMLMAKTEGDVGDGLPPIM